MSLEFLMGDFRANAFNILAKTCNSFNKNQSAKTDCNDKTHSPWVWPKNYIKYIGQRPNLFQYFLSEMHFYHPPTIEL